MVTVSSVTEFFIVNIVIILIQTELMMQTNKFKPCAVVIGIMNKFCNGSFTVEIVHTVLWSPGYQVSLVTEFLCDDSNSN